MNVELNESQASEVVIAEMLSMYEDCITVGDDPDATKACIKILEYYLVPSDFKIFREAMGIVQ